MTISNDNYKNEDDFLLKKAEDILGRCESKSPCGLMTGGYCPLLSSAAMSMTKQVK